MSEFKYGTPEYYADKFSDFLADPQANQPEYGDAIIKGFLLCLKEWRDYHKAQVDEYTRIEQRVREASAV